MVQQGTAGHPQTGKASSEPCSIPAWPGLGRQKGRGRSARGRSQALSRSRGSGTSRAEESGETCRTPAPRLPCGPRNLRPESPGGCLWHWGTRKTPATSARGGGDAGTPGLLLVSSGDLSTGLPASHSPGRGREGRRRETWSVGGTGSSPGLETGHGDRTGQRGVRGGDLQRLSLNGGLGPRFGTWGQARPWWGVVEGTPTVGPREPVPLGSAGKRGDTGWVKRCPFSDGVGSPSRRERDQA